MTGSRRATDADVGTAADAAELQRRADAGRAEPGPTGVVTDAFAEFDADDEDPIVSPVGTLPAHATHRAHAQAREGIPVAPRGTSPGTAKRWLATMLGLWLALSIASAAFTSALWLWTLVTRRHDGPGARAETRLPMEPSDR